MLDSVAFVVTTAVIVEYLRMSQSNYVSSFVIDVVVFKILFTEVGYLKS